MSTAKVSRRTTIIVSSIVGGLVVILLVGFFALFALLDSKTTGLDAANPPVNVPLAIGDGISEVGPLMGMGGDRVIGQCTVAALGYDSAGRKVAITAGHCASTDDAVFVKGGLKKLSSKAIKIGRTKGKVSTVPPAVPAGTLNLTDASIIQLDSWVTLKKSGLTIAAPAKSSIVYRKGNGLYSPAASGGIVRQITDKDFVTTFGNVTSMGDSGGPVINPSKKELYGIVSRPIDGSPVSTKKEIVATRLDAVLQELNSRSGDVVGKGFVLY